MIDKKGAMISHFHKAIFIHIPKCAGQSVEEAFCRDIGISWAERAALLLRPKGKADTDKAPERLAHLKAREYVALKYIPEDMYKKYLKFAIIRNPWDRIFSIYKYLGRGCGTFRDFTYKKLGNVESAKSLPFFWHSQYEYLCSDEGEIIVDNIVKFESMSETIENIFMKLGFSEPTLPYRNRSKDIKAKGKSNSIHASYKDFYCEETKAIIQRLYSNDIEQFGYTFEQ